MSGRRRGGFTLIEMLAVMLFTAIVLVVVVDFYIELTNASAAATAATRDGRRAAAILDRVSRDLQTAALVVKPAEMDPLAHPWVFLAEGGGDEGADRVKFVSRGRIARASAVHESDLEQVAYLLETAEDGSYDLLRWSSPRLGESLDRSFPRPGDEGVMVLSHDVAAFGVRLMSEEGEWIEEWDSSGVVQSSLLPLAAEISVAIYPEIEEDWDLEPAPPPVWVRRVDLPVRPIDLEALLTGDEEQESDDEEEDDERGMSLADCVSALAAAGTVQVTPEIQAFVAANGDAPFQAHVADLAGYGVTDFGACDP